MLNGAGLPTGTYAGNPEYYFGGEPVIDPLTGSQLQYVGGEPVLDPFTCQVVDGPDGTALTHAANDYEYHTACDPVVEQRGSNVDELGGAQVRDANGNLVYTGTAPFTYQAGQAEIANPGDQLLRPRQHERLEVLAPRDRRRLLLGAVRESPRFRQVKRSTCSRSPAVRATATT